MMDSFIWHMIILYLSINLYIFIVTRNVCFFKHSFVLCDAMQVWQQLLCFRHKQVMLKDIHMFYRFWGSYLSKLEFLFRGVRQMFNLVMTFIHQNEIQHSIKFDIFNKSMHNPALISICTKYAIFALQILRIKHSSSLYIQAITVYICNKWHK